MAMSVHEHVYLCMHRWPFLLEPLSFECFVLYTGRTVVTAGVLGPHPQVGWPSHQQPASEQLDQVSRAGVLVTPVG